MSAESSRRYQTQPNSIIKRSKHHGQGRFITETKFDSTQENHSL